jgi:hypothetical protein
MPTLASGVRPFLFPFRPVAMGVNDQQDKKNQSASQGYDERGLVPPDSCHEFKKIRRHSKSIYTGTDKNQQAD